MNAISPHVDPYLRPQTSARNRSARFAWQIVYVLLFRTSPRPLHAWRAMLLRCFRARLGQNCHIYPAARIWAPWNLECADVVAIADDAFIYNPAKITIGSHAIISQEAFLCSATHDIADPGFPMVAVPITVGSYAWICARANVMPGVTVGSGAVLGLGGLATRDLEPWTVYGGMPARKLGTRKLSAS